MTLTTTQKTKLENIKNLFHYDKELDRTLISDEIPELVKLLFQHDFQIQDFYYDTASEATDNIIEYLEQNPEDIKLEDIDLYEYIEADPYTASLTSWLNQSVYNVEYLTEALQEYEPKDGFQLLAMAQERAMFEVYNVMLNTIGNYLQAT